MRFTATFGHVDDVRVLRIDGDLLEVPAAAPERAVSPDIFVHVAPRVVGSEEAALRPAALRAAPAAAARRRWQADVRVIGRQRSRPPHRRAADCSARSAMPLRPMPSRRQSVRELRPGGAAVGGLEDAAAGPVRRRVGVPRRTTRVPETGVDDAASSSDRSRLRPRRRLSFL